MMDSNTTYTKTGRGLRAVVRKLPKNAGHVLSILDKGLNGEQIQEALPKISNKELEIAISWLLEGGFIKGVVVDPFSNTIWDDSNKSSIEVDEIDIDQFTISEKVPQTKKQPAIKKTKEELIAEAEKKAKIEAETKKLEQADAEARQRAEGALKAKNEAEVNKGVEAKAKVEAEERAKKEAEEKKRAEEKAAATEKARLEKEEKAKQEAIAKAEKEAKEREEAEARAKAEAEERAKKEAEEKKRAEEKAAAAEKARLEKKEKAKQEAIAKAEKEAKAKEEAEAKAKAKAEAKAKKEEEARIKAEEKAAAKEKARLEKEEKAKQAAIAKAEKEAKAKEEAEAKAKAKAEAKAKKQEEARIRAEEKAEAKEQAKQAAIVDAEKAAKEKEEAEANAQREALDQAEARAAAQIAEEKKALEKAAEKERAKLEAKAKKEEKAFKRAEKNAEAEIKRQRVIKNLRSQLPGKQFFTNIVKSIKPISIFALAVLFLLIIAAQFINMRILIDPIEKIATENIQDKVHIKAVNLSLFPRPHLLLKEITIADRKSINAKKIRVFPNLLALKDKLLKPSNTPYEIESIEINNFNIAQKDISRIQSWSGASSRGQQLKIKKIALSELSINLNVVQLPFINGEITLDNAGLLEEASFITEDKNLNIKLNRSSGDYGIKIDAARWRAPISPFPIFTKLNGSGVIKNNLLKLTSVTGDIYNGNVSGTLEMDLEDSNLATKGEFNVTNFFLGDMGKELQLDLAVDGKLNIKGSYAFDMNKPLNTIDMTKLSANFNIKNGQLKKVDIAEAMRSGNLSGYTDFSSLSGEVLLNNQTYTYRKLSLKDRQLSANGYFSVNQKQQVSGVISSSIAIKRNPIRARLVIGGPINALRLKK